MKNLDAAVKRYLSQKTDYAILINGEWGSGKTHYLKNNLRNIIEKYKVHNEDSLTYKFIYISLYGQKSIQNIREQIFFEIFPIVNNKVSKTVFKLGKGIMNRFLKKEDWDAIISDVSDSGSISESDLVKYNTLVICFDDLERRDKSVDVNSVFGYINELTQDFESKIIIVSNENKDDTSVIEIKERVVGITIQFEPDLEELLEDILDKKFNNCKSYSFLKSHKLALCAFSKKHSSNLRTLIFSINIFEEIYKLIESHYGNESDVNINKMLENVLHFTLSVCVQYRLGQLNYKNLDDFRKFDISEIDFSDFSSVVVGNKTSLPVGDTELNIKDEFVKKYYGDRNEFVFLKSVFLLITTFNDEYLLTLNSEISENYELSSEVKLDNPNYVYNMLHNWALTLTDEEYRLCVNRIMSFLNEGKYNSIVQYYNIYFEIIFRYKNPLNLTKRTFIRYIKRGILSNKSIELMSDIEFNMTFGEPQDPDLSELVVLLKELNSRLFKSRIKTDLKTLKSSFANLEFADFMKEASNFEAKYNAHKVSYLNYFSVESIVSVIKKRTPIFIDQFHSYIIKRYDHSFSSLRGERDFIYRLKKKLQSTKFVGIKLALINRLVLLLEDKLME